MPKIFKIIKYPDPILKKKSENIPLIKIGSAALRKFCANMISTMLKKDGIGLAAPQIGKNIRLITVNTKGGVIVFINPKITRRSFSKEWGEEGCLSVPGIFGQVKRNKKVKCCYFDINSNSKKIEASGLLARVIQHEINHLDGILFIDKAKAIKKVMKKN